MGRALVLVAAGMPVLMDSGEPAGAGEAACASVAGEFVPGARKAPALVLLLVGVLVLVYLGWRFLPRVVRTADGLAFVRTLRVADGSRIRVLSQGGVYQSATYLDDRRFEPVFAYQRAFDVMFTVEDTLRARRGRGIERVLAIGGGGFAWPKHAVMQHPELVVDVAEVDQAVINVARRWFFLAEAEALSQGRLRVVCADGRMLLAQEGERYDAIVNDAFCGSEPAYTLATVEAARDVRTRLVPGGLYLVNVVSREGGSDLAFLRDVVATLCEVFAQVWVLPASDESFGGEDNYLVIASDSELQFPDAIPFDQDFLGTPLWDKDLR